MKIRSLLATAALVVAVVILFLQRSQISKLTADLQSARQQLDGTSEATASTPAPAAPVTDANEQSELLRLRAEVTALRRQTNDVAKLRAENNQMRAALAAASKPPPAPAEQSSAPEERLHAVARINDSRQYVLALLMHSEDNQQHFATNLEQVAPYLSKGSVTGTNEFDIVFQGSRDGVTNSSNIILVREHQPRQRTDGRWTRAYGFLDGHSEMRTELTSNFDAFELEHSSQPQ